VRTRYLDVREPRRIDGRWDGLRIDSETCVRLLPETGQLAQASGAINPGRMSLVTPLAGPGDMEKILDLIEAAPWRLFFRCGT